MNGLKEMLEKIIFSTLNLSEEDKVEIQCLDIKQKQNIAQKCLICTEALINSCMPY